MRRRGWSWQLYLKEQQAVEAPPTAFTQVQVCPRRRTGFQVGMKLESIDPFHPSMFCVLTVAEVIGCRLRLHFDAFSDCYDFWVNADSAEIKPAGWCKQTGRKLHPPKGVSEQEFDWPTYLQSTDAPAAPPTLFSSTTAGCVFEKGMKVEAVDKKNPGLVCVASVCDVINDRLLIHFDNWDDTYDYWCDSSSPYIHPIGWCQSESRPLTAPQGHPEPFDWTDYLQQTGTKAAPPTAFVERAPHLFQVDQKLEVVDKRNPALIRVATVTDRDQHRVKVRCDGWSSLLDVWLDSDDADLHPVGWCQRTGHPLEPPPGSCLSPSQGVCPTAGCRGVGHIKGAKYSGHHSSFGCPYSEVNIKKAVVVPDRLGEQPATFITSSLHHHHHHHHHHHQEDNQESSGDVQSESEDESSGKRRRETDSFSQPTRLLGVKQEEEELAEGRESVFLSAQPGRDLSLCWRQHRKIFPGVPVSPSHHVQHWDIQQVSDFVRSLPGCEGQAELFRDEQIDGRAFLLLTQRDIVRIMSIKLGPALKIYNSILMFKHADDGGQSQPGSSTQAPPPQKCL